MKRVRLDDKSLELIETGLRVRTAQRHLVWLADRLDLVGYGGDGEVLRKAAKLIEDWQGRFSLVGGLGEDVLYGEGEEEGD